MKSKIIAGKHTETVELVKNKLLSVKKNTKFTVKYLENYVDKECEISRVLVLNENKHIKRI